VAESWPVLDSQNSLDEAPASANVDPYATPDDPYARPKPYRGVSNAHEDQAVS
jgi:hypothetical protein